MVVALLKVPRLTVSFSLGMSTTRLQRVLRVCNFGPIPVKYSEALSLQERLAELCKQKQAPDTLLQLQPVLSDAILDGTVSTVDDNSMNLLQHARVYTLGKRGQIAHFKVPKSSLEEQGIDIHNAGRGGETTFHGPGQIVLYPVINLRRLGLGARAYVEALEDCMVDACSQYGIHARGRVPGRTGVWVDDRKIGAIGVKISSGVASHGVAMNISTDLRYFDNIVPCGIEKCVVTSVEKETDKHVDIEDFGHLLVKQFHEKLKYKNVTSIASSEVFAPGAIASS